VRGTVVSTNEMLELVQLAEVLYPVILLDLPYMTEADLLGTLVWLRHKIKGVAP